MEWIDISKHGNPEPGYYIGLDKQGTFLCEFNECCEEWYPLEGYYRIRNPTHYMHKPNPPTKNLPESTKSVAKEPHDPEKCSWVHEGTSEGYKVWFDGSKYKPKTGTQIFVWDVKQQKQIMLNAFWEENAYFYDPNFPMWKYAYEGFEPINIEENQ